MLDKSLNKISIEGILKEKNIEFAVDSEGVNYIKGNIVIKNDNGEYEVNLFAKQLTSTGKENSLFKGYKTVNEKYVSIAEAILNGVSEEEVETVATKVNVNGELSIEEYIGRDGELKTFWKLKGTFINSLKSTDTYAPKATFEVDLYTTRIVPEVERGTGAETGRVIVEGFLANYNKDIKPIKLISSINTSAHLKNNYQTNLNGTLFGNIVNNVSDKVVKKGGADSGGFGEEMETVYHSVIKELQITGGTSQKENWTQEELKTAKATREVYINNLKNKDNTVTAQPTSTQSGFGASPMGAQTNKYFNKF